MTPTDLAPVAPLVSADLSIWGLFWSAHIVVKGVMIGLLVASIWVWAIVVDKTLLFIRTKRAMDIFEQTFWRADRWEEFSGRNPRGPGSWWGRRSVAEVR